jgi:hypothetical protein
MDRKRSSSSASAGPLSPSRRENDDGASCDWAYASNPSLAAAASLMTPIKRSPPAANDDAKDQDDLKDQDMSDAVTGLLSSPFKKLKMNSPSAAANQTEHVAGYSPELSKALKSVVKIFTTMAS